MGKKSNNGAALKEQKKANAQAQKNFERQMKLMQKQLKNAGNIHMPAYEAPPPGPTRSSADVAAAGREARLSSRRRYGFNQSVSSAAGLGGGATL